jgi:glycosyltransferase involved in cell wall biosynthesis
VDEELCFFIQTKTDIKEMNNSGKKVLINMSNLHKGGGLQVGISFASELLKLPAPKYNVKVLISKEIRSSLNEEMVLSSKWNFQVLDTYGLKTLVSTLRDIEKSYDLVFTLFGPKYTVNTSAFNIVGFAQAWIIYPNNSAQKSLPWIEKVKTRLKFLIQEKFFQKADHIIVELEHVKEALEKKAWVNRESVSVIHNTISSLYFDREQWVDIGVPRQSDEIAIGFVTRDYAHKNISVLPSVAKLLNQKFGVPVKFYFTLTDQEWDNYKDQFGDYGMTVGELSVNQCPRFYEQLDAVVFPSLLECFSATPLEALAMRVPLFASDRGFVKDVCSEHAIYFDPLDANNIANAIANYFLGDKKSVEEFDQARDHALEFSSAEERAKGYLEIIEQYLEK